jgi:hypothetical protein
MMSMEIDHTAQVSLKLTEGRVADHIILLRGVSDTCLLFFESNRNLIEGDITLRQTSSSVVRESVARLRPGWKRIARGANAEPIEFVLDDLDVREINLEFHVCFYNRNPFIANRAESEQVLVVFIRQ